MGGTTLSKFFGLALAVFGLLQPRLCYAFPPIAFWWFAIYLFIFALWSSYLVLSPPNVPQFNSLLIESFSTLTQLLVLFWISYNLMKQEYVSSGALWALAGGATCLAILQILGITGDVAKQGRMTAFSEQNPNSLATVLALGLLALFGLAYGREKNDWKARLLFWLGSGILAVTMVQTGSRGAVLAVAGALSVFFLKGRRLATKLKFGLLGLGVVVVLATASYQIDAVKKRWEQTWYEESLARREEIYPAAVAMILESPVIGWGPVNHLWELGPRVGKASKDEHNLYLYILAEVGLVGSIPFFAALWLCWRAAWGARHSMQGILPLVMLSFLLVGGLKGTPHKSKLFWVVLSYSLASGCYMVRPQHSKVAASLMYRNSGAIRRRYKLVTAPATGRPRRVSRTTFRV